MTYTNIDILSVDDAEQQVTQVWNVSITQEQVRRMVAESILRQLGIDPEMANYQIHMHTPDLVASLTLSESGIDGDLTYSESAAPWSIEETVDPEDEDIYYTDGDRQQIIETGSPLIEENLPAPVQPPDPIHLTVPVGHVVMQDGKAVMARPPGLDIAYQEEEPTLPAAYAAMDGMAMFTPVPVIKPKEEESK